MILGKLSIPGCPTNWDKSGAKIYWACSRCGRWLFRHFFSRLSFLFSFLSSIFFRFLFPSLGDGPI